MPALPLAVPPPIAGYRALGTEPFWSLKIGSRQMRLERLGRRAIAVRTPVPRRDAAGIRYATRRMTVTIVRRACGDGMSDRVFRDTVTVVVARERLNGCGGPFTGPAAP